MTYIATKGLFDSPPQENYEGLPIRHPKQEIDKNKKHEFTIFLTNNSRMKNLNYKFRKKNKSTDVLSFPLNCIFRKNLYLGDIAINFDVINNRSIKSSFFKEFDKMWIHGYCHLLGYDHKKIKDFKEMIKKENLILNCFYKKN